MRIAFRGLLISPVPAAVAHTRLTYHPPHPPHSFYEHYDGQRGERERCYLVGITRKRGRRRVCGGYNRLSVTILIIYRPSVHVRGEQT